MKKKETFEVMDSQTLPKVPVIHFTEETVKPGSISWTSTCKDVVHALEEYGYFVAIHDKFSSELSNGVFDATKELFDLPTETRVRNISKTPGYGYIKRPQIPLYEGLGIENATTGDAVQRFTNIMWPSGNEHFCEIIQNYTKLASELEQTVTKMVFESYGVEKYYDAHAGSTQYLLRLLKYSVPQVGENDLGLIPHTDKNFISIVHTNQIGLEVKANQDDVWIAVEFPPSSFLVMAGEVFLAWSNGRVTSAPHRVILKGETDRYTLGLFSSKTGTTTIPEELVDDEHPLRFKAFDQLGLLSFHMTEEGQRHKFNSVIAYCGI